MNLYKLTDQNDITHLDTKWGEGVTHKLPPCQRPRLCSSTVIHAYQNANLAYLLNPIHGAVRSPKLYKAEGKVVVQDWGKVGCFELTTVEEMAPPSWVGSKKEWEVQLLFSILCTEHVVEVFNKKYPDDSRVSEAILAARTYLKTPTVAAAHAAYAAADAADTAYAGSNNLAPLFCRLADEAAKTIEEEQLG